MKRILILFLFLFLFTGCQKAPEVSTPTESTPSAEPTLLNSAQAVSADENLVYIPNTHVESMICPEILLYKNSLILYEQTMDGRLQIKRISLEDGSLLAEAVFPASPAAQLQTSWDSVIICDRGSGQVMILGDSLEAEQVYTVPSEGEYWYLSPLLDTLYVFSEEGLSSRNFVTGQTRQLLDNAAFTQPMGAENDYVFFSYTDLADQKTYTQRLTLSTAELETVSASGSVCADDEGDVVWLLWQDITAGKYLLHHQDTTGTFLWPEGLVELIPDSQSLLMTDGNYRELYLYDLDGIFISRCVLSQQEYASVGTDLIWSDYWEGYFFRDTYDNVSHLMFWDIDLPQTGDNLAITPLYGAPAQEHLAEQALYDKAADISQRFGLDIRIAEQCALVYSHYEADLLTDAYCIQDALETLEQALSCYPEGFFRQLPYGSMHRIQIELVTNLTAKDGIDTHPTVANGFASAEPDCYLIVLNGASLSFSTVYHEFSHIIDKRLEWDALLRPEALFSEEVWLSLQPEGFRYAESYTDMPEAVHQFEDSGYFVRSYSMTFPTEDRATLMALAISENQALHAYPGMEAKMQYYAQCIRDCFHTDGWPEKTAWE